MMLIGFIEKCLKKYREISLYIRNIHNTIYLLDKQVLKSGFDNNLIVFDDSAARFIFNNQQYLKNRNSEDTTKRLFITTGGISLITCLSIINKIGADNYEDYLVIIGTTSNHIFVESNTNIALLYSFKKIIFLLPKEINFRILIDFGIEKIDEIFMVANLIFYSRIITLYPNVNYTLFEESPATLSYPIYDYSKIRKVIVHNYLEKFDFFVWHKTNTKPEIEFIDETIFNKILSNTRKELNIAIKLDDNVKYILICGPDVQQKRYVRISTIYKTINKLVKCGYKILFKNHPRDMDQYIFDDNVIIINTSYPIELYDLKIVAVVSFSLSVCITVPCFNGVATFSYLPVHNKIDDLDFRLMQFMIKQYTVPIDILLNFDHINYTPQDLRKKLLEIFKTNIDKIPSVSDNLKIEKFITRNRKRLGNANLKKLT
jgi:hypothetical protein